MFIDSEFPPDIRSLGTIREGNVFSQRIQDKIEWKRITELYNKPIEDFYNIHPNDIQQGNLGDCYLLSALSALAEFPERVRKLFHTTAVSPEGKYTIELYHNGMKQIYDIDDYFPSIHNTIAFSGPRYEDDIIELWVILLEKVWAKRYGGYFNIELGFTEDVLRDLTGAPCEKILTSYQDLWNVLFESNKKNYIINGSIDHNLELNNSIGLVTLHAYAVIDAQEYLYEKLLKIRNPWGRHEFTGDWSDQSSKWTEHAKKTLQWEAKDDGCFWMNILDFKRYFASVSICMVEDSYKYESISSMNNCFKVSFYGKGSSYFTVTQQAETPIRIIVASSNGYIAGKSGVGRDVWISINCEYTDYFIYTERYNNNLPITFSVYAEKIMKIEEIMDIDLINRIWNVEIAKNIKNCRVNQIENGITVYKCEMIGANGREFYEGFVYDIIENTLLNEKAIIEMIINEKDNIEIIGDINFILKPGQSKTVIYKHTNLLSAFKLQIEARVKLIPNNIS